VFDLLDIDQLELLRGPQGTLFGKNTTAGVLNISTRKPTFTPEGRVSSSLGEDGYVQNQASVSGPLSTTVAGRVSAYRTRENGYVKNDFDGHTLGGGTRQGVRGQLLRAQRSVQRTLDRRLQRRSVQCRNPLAVQHRADHQRRQPLPATR